jgi:hypothetical protein
VTAADEWDDEHPNPMLDDDDGDWRDYDDDPDDYPEPDGGDYEIARAYEDEAEHRETVHGGGECDCRPSLRDRLAWQAADAVRRLGNARARMAIAMRGVHTIRLGRAEFTLRLNADRACGACGGKGWFYTTTPKPSDPIPTGYNGASLCGCGSAIGKLAGSRRHLRRTDKQPPF